MAMPFPFLYCQLKEKFGQEINDFTVTCLLKIDKTQTKIYNEKNVFQARYKNNPLPSLSISNE